MRVMQVSRGQEEECKYARISCQSVATMKTREDGSPRKKQRRLAIVSVAARLHTYSSQMPALACAPASLLSVQIPTPSAMRSARSYFEPSDNDHVSGSDSDHVSGSGSDSDSEYESDVAESLGMLVEEVIALESQSTDSSRGKKRKRKPVSYTPPESDDESVNDVPDPDTLYYPRKITGAQWYVEDGKIDRKYGGKCGGMRMETQWRGYTKRHSSWEPREKMWNVAPIHCLRYGLRLYEEHMDDPAYEGVCKMWRKACDYIVDAHVGRKSRRR